MMVAIAKKMKNKNHYILCVLLDLLSNSTSAGNLYVGSVLESSCTSMYTPVLCSDSPSNSLPEASWIRGLKTKIVKHVRSRANLSKAVIAKFLFHAVGGDKNCGNPGKNQIDKICFITIIKKAFGFFYLDHHEKPIQPTAMKGFPRDDEFLFDVFFIKTARQYE